MDNCISSKASSSQDLPRMEMTGQSWLAQWMQVRFSRTWVTVEGLWVHWTWSSCHNSGSGLTERADPEGHTDHK